MIHTLINYDHKCYTIFRAPKGLYQFPSECSPEVLTELTEHDFKEYMSGVAYDHYEAKYGWSTN